MPLGSESGEIRPSSPHYGFFNQTELNAKTYLPQVTGHVLMYMYKKS